MIKVLCSSFCIFYSYFWYFSVVVTSVSCNLEKRNQICLLQCGRNTRSFGTGSRQLPPSSFLITASFARVSSNQFTWLPCGRKKGDESTNITFALLSLVKSRRENRNPNQHRNLADWNRKRKKLWLKAILNGIECFDASKNGPWLKTRRVDKGGGWITVN